MIEKTNTLQFLSELLPKELKENYILEEILTVNNHNTILLLSSKKSEKKFVLKILEKDYYDNTLSKSLNALSEKHLFLPLKTDFDMSYVYLLYPKRKTLSEILLQEGLHYAILYRLIKEIGNAIITLHKNHILHLDITPDNIFLDENNHFYLGDFSSSLFIKKKLFFHFFDKCLHTGTTPAFAPQDTNDNHVSFWNDQYSFALLIYALFNNGILPVKESIQEHCFFPTANQVLKKAMNFPSAISKEMFSQFFSELENALKKDEEFFNCKNYQIQLMETDETICKSSTPECTIQKENKVKIQSSSFSNHFQIPIPLYGLFLFCASLFLFSLYHYIVQNAKDTSNPIKEYHQQSALLPSPDNLEKNKNLNTSLPTVSNIPKAISTNMPDISIETDKGGLKESTKKVLDISNSNYHNKEFLKKSIKPEYIEILFANSCQFTNSTSFSDFTNLKELYLYNNPLSSVTALSKMKFLETLVLSKCNLHDISCLSKIKTLTILDLSQNKHLKGISYLSSLKNLNYLIVTHTNTTQEDIRFLQKRLPHCTILY